jgi:hypothetical protein
VGSIASPRSSTYIVNTDNVGAKVPSMQDSLTLRREPFPSHQIGTGVEFSYTFVSSVRAISCFSSPSSLVVIAMTLPVIAGGSGMNSGTL